MPKTVPNSTHFLPDPLPMKQRALPQSFWQQPNVANPQPPGVVCSALPALPLGEGSRSTGDEVDITPVEEVASPVEVAASSGAASAVAASTNSVRTKIISAANTDLLFSLFNVVEEEEVQRRIHVVKRGRCVQMNLLKSGPQVA